MKTKPAFIVLIYTLVLTGCVNDNLENNIIPSSPDDTKTNTEYYWAGNQKITVQPQPEKSFIIFNEASRYDIIDVSKMDYHIFKTAKVPEGRMFEKGLTRTADAENVSWAIGTTRAFATSNDQILYKSQAYKNSKGIDIFVSHIFYVKLKSTNDYAELQRIANNNGVDIIGKAVKHSNLWYKLACSPESDCDALVMSARFYESELFQYAEPDIMFEVRSCSKQPNSYPEYQATAITSEITQPNDPLFQNQWYLNNPGGLDINYLEAKAITQGSNYIKIRLSDIDRIAYNHPDLPEIERDELETSADDWHGTACAGIICAQTDNSEGIAGIAPNCQLHYVQVPHTYNVDNVPIIAGIFGGAFGYDVLSCSWYIPDIFDDHNSMMIEDAIHARFQDGRWHHTCDKDLGTVIVFAAGNDDRAGICYPASSAPEAIVVGAMMRNGTRHPSSNYGIGLDLVAPGETITTTSTLTLSNAEPHSYPPEIAYQNNFNMTSAACPQVAAVAALILSINPDLFYYEVENYITSTATILGRKADGTYDGSCSSFFVGAGLLNAGEALKAVLNDLNNQNN